MLYINYKPNVLFNTIFNNRVKFRYRLLGSKKKCICLYCGVYYIIYGKEETTEEKLNKLIEKEKRQDQLLIEAIDKMNIQELELSRLNNKLKDENDNNKESIDDYVVIL